jgi:hypothetical protein
MGAEKRRDRSFQGKRLGCGGYTKEAWRYHGGRKEATLRSHEETLGGEETKGFLAFLY